MPKSSTATLKWLEEMAHIPRRQSRVSVLRTRMLHALPFTAIGVLLIACVFTVTTPVSALSAVIGTAAAVAMFLVWPVVVMLWRLRVEIGFLVSISAVWFLLPPLWAFSLTVVIPVCALLAPPSRQWVVAQAWCVITRHRVTGILARSVKGRGSVHAPFVVWSSATTAGERLWVWLPSGVAREDLEKARERIAAACWVQQCHITPHERFSHLSRIDTMRRDQLGRPVTSPVAAALPDETPSAPADTASAEKILSSLPTRTRRAREEFGKPVKHKKSPVKTSTSSNEDPI